MTALFRTNLVLMALVITLAVVRSTTGPSWLDTVGPLLIGILFGSTAILAAWALARVAQHPVRRHRIAREYARSDD